MGARHIAILLLLLTMAPGCAARQPHEQFSAKKYRIRTTAKDGTPAVVQRYYAKQWLMRRQKHKVR